MDYKNNRQTPEERYLVSLDCQNIPASIAHGWVGYKFSCYTIDWKCKDSIEYSAVLTAMDQDKQRSAGFKGHTPIRVIGNLNVTGENIPSILNLWQQAEECNKSCDSLWLVVCADSLSTLDDIYRTCFLYYTDPLSMAPFDFTDLREALGAVLSTKIQILTSGPYSSSENGLSLPKGGRFVLCDAHVGDIPKSWSLVDLEELLEAQYSKLAVDPAYFLDITFFYCPFEHHRIIYTKEILGAGSGLSDQEAETLYSIADNTPISFDGRSGPEKKN